MTRLLNIIIAVLAVALVLVIWYPQYQENQPVRVRFACDSSLTALPILVGIEESTFVQNKIIPELVFFNDPEVAIESLFSGSVDVAVVPWSTVFKRMIAKQETMKVFMAQEFRTAMPADRMFKPAKSRLKTVADLKGKRLAYPPQLRDYVAPVLLTAGLSVQAVKLIELPVSAIPAAIAAGQADAGWMLEPYVCQLNSPRLDSMGSFLSRIYSPFPAAAIGFAPRLLASKYKALRRRLKIASDASGTLVETKPDIARAVLIKHFPNAGDFCTEECRSCRLPGMLRLKEIEAAALTALAAQLVKAGSLSDTVKGTGIVVEPMQMAP